MSELTNQDRLLKYAKKKKLVRPRDLPDIKGVRVLISRLVKNGELVKAGRGLYSLAAADYNEQQSLLEIAQRMPKAVICLLSALRFHELTTQNPFEVWIAIEGMSRKPNLESTPLKVMRFSGNSFTEGVEIKKTNGIALKVYNPAKTVADCFKYRNKVGLDKRSRRFATPGGRRKLRWTISGITRRSAEFQMLCGLTSNLSYDPRKEKSSRLGPPASL